VIFVINRRHTQTYDFVVGYFDSKPSAKALRFFFVDEQGEGKSIYAISDRDISSVSLLTDTFQVSLVS
jgi:hypothetical protein